MLLFTSVLAAEPPVATLVAVGDILPHRRVKASARAYGWQATFAPVSPWLKQADLTFGNLESPIAPDHHKGIHGEVFNAPATLATGLAEAGFDVLSMANNHVFDQGADGLVETRDRIQAAGMSAVGAGSTCAEAEAAVVREVNGVRFAFVAMVDLLNIDGRTTQDAACTFVTGPLCTSNCLPDRDALFYRTDLPKVTRVIEQARSKADIVVVSLHAQNEYRTTPLSEYRPIIQAMVAAGADLVVAHHPHVLQPVEQVQVGGRSAWVAWSLGNFVSDMGRSYNPSTHPIRKGNTRDGLMMWVDVHRNGDGYRLQPSLIPTWTRHTLGDTEKIDVLPDHLRPEAERRTTHVRGILKSDLIVKPAP